MHYKILNIFFFYLLLSGCTVNYLFNSAEYRLIPVTTDLEDKEIIDIILPYKLGVDSIMDEILCYSDKEMTKGNPQSLIGNFVTDLCLEMYDSIADICVMNNGGLRSILPKGVITRRDLYKLMPFENELVVVELNQKEKQELFSYIISRNGEPFSGSMILVTKENKIKEVDNNQNSHTHSGKWTTLEGDTVPWVQSFKNDTICKICGTDYINITTKILTSDYLANGGDNMSFFDGKNQNKVGIKVRDAIINYCILKDTISSSLDQRIRYDE